MEFLEALKSIIKKDVSELTDYEKEFIRARQSYLTEEEIKKFSEVLIENKEENEEDKEDGTKKKGRKKLT